MYLVLFQKKRRGKEEGDIKVFYNLSNSEVIWEYLRFVFLCSESVLPHIVVVNKDDSSSLTSQFLQFQGLEVHLTF